MIKHLVVFGGICGLALGTCSFARARQAWGDIHGRVVLGGNDAVPEPKELKVDKDQKHCLSKGPIASEELVVNKANRGVRWAFVWLAPLGKSGPPLAIHPSLKDIKEKQVVLDQPCCMFTPHAIAIREGQDIVAKNSSPIVHNTHWQGNPLKNPGGNRSIGAGQSLVIDGLKTDRLPVKVNCDIHPWMNSWIGVFDHPYFALTDENGNFNIKLAPVGEYRLVVWHEKVGWVPPRVPGQEPGMPVTVTGKGLDVGNIEMKLDKK
jgi:hypothetical protein